MDGAANGEELSRSVLIRTIIKRYLQERSEKA
jgi:metal-responsive CopG/Arc/MetJ family transcriptional regulator